MTTCQTRRVNEVDSIAVGPQDVPFVCGREATVRIFLHGALYDMCERCGSEAVEQLGGKQADPRLAIEELNKLSVRCDAVASELAPWPGIAEWLEDASVALRQMAEDLQRPL